MIFIPTRSAGLARLADFLPRAGRAYAANRNHDNGWPTDGGSRPNVSQLSPWLHSGLLSEREVIEAVLEEHSPDAAEKFVMEVFWRIYFKGYLEQHPGAWGRYCANRDTALRRIEGDTGLHALYLQATEGRTGIAVFDHWAKELVETGYLHNHARMWFASLWIFTLGLDWELGADFFLRHLIDGDAASNTLSWRWVGGLHTKGKTYLAQPENIARFTANHPLGPFYADGLAQEAQALKEPVMPARKPLDLPHRFDLGTLREPYALILHDEAASAVPFDLPYPPAIVIGAARPEARSPYPVGKPARAFAESAVLSGAQDAEQTYNAPFVTWTRDLALADILGTTNVQQVVLPYLPTGWTRDALMPHIASLLSDRRARVLLNDLNRATWPYATAGFFGVKKRIDHILAGLGSPGRISSAST